MKLSIVTTLYNTTDFLEEFLRRCQLVINQLKFDSFEVILVDDGSTDQQLLKAKEICGLTRNTTLITLSRNFGHHQAIIRGLEHSDGDFVFLVDSDLEEDPLHGVALFNAMKISTSDLVYGYQQSRRGNTLERITGKLFYTFIRRFMNVDIPENFMTARIMTRRYVDALISHKEYQVNFSGLSQIVGFKQSGIPLEKLRLRKSTYSFTKKIAILIDAVSSFSVIPLKFIFRLGFSIFATSSLLIFVVSFNSLFNQNPASGWASLMLSIWFLGGLIMLSLGIIGIYVSRVFIETKGRPRTIVREILSSDK